VSLSLATSIQQLYPGRVEALTAGDSTSIHPERRLMLCLLVESFAHIFGSRILQNEVCHTKYWFDGSSAGGRLAALNRLADRCSTKHESKKWIDAVINREALIENPRQ
jgi:hypothetical protein